MTYSQARKRLAAYVAENGGLTQVAKSIGCGKSHLHHVLAGRKSFGLKYALAIEAQIKIPSSAWFTRRTTSKTA